MSQSRKGTLIEVTFSLVVGFILSMILGHFLFAYSGHDVSLEQNFWWTAAFTVLSFCRSYVLRRFFNWLHVKGALQ